MAKQQKKHDSTDNRRVSIAQKMAALVKRAEQGRALKNKDYQQSGFKI